MLRTVLRASAVLDLFSVEQPDWGATGVSRALGISKSQACEMLSTLAESGLLQRRATTGRYQLGWRVAALHAIFARTSDVKLAAAPVMRELAARHQANIHLAAWDRGRVLYIDKRTDSRATPTPKSSIGARLPAHSSAVGKQLLAARIDEHDSPPCDGTLPAFTARTVTSAERLAEELAEVRRAGVAYDLGEYVDDVRCVAAGIRDAGGGQVAALSITLDASRWQPRRDALAVAVLDAAAQVEHGLRERVAITERTTR